MKKYIYIFVAIAVLCCFGLFFQMEHHSIWDVKTADPNGHEPYDMAVFDSLLYRSLPNGYDVKHWDVVAASQNKCFDDYDHVSKYKDVPKPLCLADSLNPKKQSVLIVQRTEWYDDDNGTFDVLKDALDYADKGGDVLLVREQLGYGDSFLNRLTYKTGETLDYSSESGFPFTYDLKELSEKEGYTFMVETSEGKMNITSTFAPSYIRKYDYDKTNSTAEIFVKKMSLSCEIYMSNRNVNEIYGVAFHNKKTGGNVYLCTLGLYFSNLGVTIPEGDKIIAYNMGKIDKNPVVRVDYDKLVYNGTGKDSGLDQILSVLSRNKALSFAWSLVLLMAALILICGIYRKHPAKRDAHLIYVDETDPVAVREAKFRQSPLLHFIFQYSWLYMGKRNYIELFMINYRQFARYVNRKTGVELNSADNQELEKASAVLAQRTGLELADIRQDLIWMQVNKLNTDNESIISPKDYIKSQQIIEKYL